MSHSRTQSETRPADLALGFHETEAGAGQALDAACRRDRSARTGQVRVLSGWAAAGQVVEMVGAYLSALGLAVLLSDLGLGALQIAQAEVANATLRVGQAPVVPLLPIGQVTALLWLVGFPLWTLGRGIRRGSTFRLSHYASRGEIAEPLGYRFAPPCPLVYRLMARFRR